MIVSCVYVLCVVSFFDFDTVHDCVCIMSLVRAWVSESMIIILIVSAKLEAEVLKISVESTNNGK